MELNTTTGDGVGKVRLRVETRGGVKVVKSKKRGGVIDEEEGLAANKAKSPSLVTE